MSTRLDGMTQPVYKLDQVVKTARRDVYHASPRGRKFEDQVLPAMLGGGNANSYHRRHA